MGGIDDKGQAVQSGLLYLQIRNLIAAREFNTAHANQELSRGGWLWDHAQYDQELAAQIEALFEKANNREIEP